MQHRRQSKDACLAYALFQIGAVSVAAVGEYERSKAYESWDLVVSWLTEHAPELLPLEGILHGKPIPGSQHNLKGKGVVMLVRPATSHTISYEDEVVLDPARPEARLSLEAYLLRYSYFEVLKIVPIEEPKSRTKK